MQVPLAHLAAQAQEFSNRLGRQPTNPTLAMRCSRQDQMIRRTKQKSRQTGGFWNRDANQRFENCLRRRALWKPTFLRSTSRASRVTKPALESAGFKVPSYSIRARVIP